MSYRLVASFVWSWLVLRLILIAMKRGRYLEKDFMTEDDLEVDCAEKFSSGLRIKGMNFKWVHQKPLWQQLKWIIGTRKPKLSR